MNTKPIALLVVMLPLAAIAQISYNGGIYTQNFDTLQSGAIFIPYTNFPTGWTTSQTYNSGSYVWTSVTNGYSNNYGEYCFSSSASDPDKSIGLVIGSTGQAYLGARFHNATGATLTTFSVSYIVKQWAKGAVTANDQVIPLSYSLNATNLTSGTYVSVSALDMHSIIDGDGVFAALNGNAVSNQAFVAGTVSGISWLPNQDLWIRWSGVSHGFNQSHALAVDDFTFSAVPKLQITTTSPARFQILWSTNYHGYILQSAPTPAPKIWNAVTNVPTIMGDKYGVEVDMVDAQRFFHLIKQ
jgi:hypothetical protein